MKGIALLLLCAVALSQADRPQLSLSGRICDCHSDEAKSICARHDFDGKLIVHENCNQFYKCSNGQALPYFCPTNLLYDPVAEICDWPSNVKCESRPIVEESEANCSGEEADNDIEEPDNDPTEAPGLCAADGSNGVLVAHENCNQFYECANGVPVTHNCYGNLMYNPFTKQCDWPENVKCGDRPIVDIEDGNNNESGNEDNSNPSKICSADGSNGVLVAHDNCNQFYRCEHGVPVAFTCPLGLLYNPLMKLCDWAAKVECGDRPIVEIDDGSDDNETTSPCNCNPDEASGICASKDSDGTLVAHENCSKFFKCANGAPVAFSCPSGLLYNPYNEMCDWADKVDCGDRVVEVEEGDSGDNEGGTNNEGNCNPSEAPAICAASGSDGVLVAHENCNQFYGCELGVPVAYTCPLGLLYNPLIELCDWAAKVDCGDRPIAEIDDGNGDSGTGDNENTGPCKDSDKTLVAHENCNQFFKCTNGIPVAFACPSGLLYNPYNEVCDWADKVECGDRPIVEIDSGNGGDGNGGIEDGDNEGGNEGPCNCNPGEAPSICAITSSDGTLVAHENCNQFYKCANGVPVSFICPSGLLYNPYIEMCDWPGKVECGDRPIVEIDSGNGDDESGDIEDGDNEGGNEGPCNCNPGEAPGICAITGSDGTLVAHENCNQFYKCANGVPVTFICPSGLLYNPYIEICNWADKVECRDRPIVEIDSGNGDDGNGDIEDGDNEGGNEGPCNCNPGEAPGICAITGSGGTFVAHENCNQFYKCANGVPVSFICPSGLLYNPYIEMCDWAGKVECGDRPIVEVEEGGDGDNEGETDNGGNCDPSEAPALCAASGSDGIFVAHENCNQFYKCSAGLPVALTCPSTLLYKPVTGRCDWPQNVDCGDRIIPGGDDSDNGDGDNGDGDNDGGNEGTCNCNPEEAPAICETGNSEGVLIAHEKCNKFYKCSFGSLVAVACPENLLYNPFIEVCDWPENVECGDRVISDGSGSDKDSGENDGNDNGGDNEIGNNDPSQAPTICAADGSNGVLVAHANCNQFYVCASGLPEVLSCPTNLLYNPSIEQCDWPRNVDCGGRIVPEAPDTEGDGSPCLCNPRQASTICAESSSNGKMIAHEMCNQFYVCFNSKAIALSCPASLFYDPDTKQCNWPAAVSCDGRDVTTYHSLNKHMHARRGNI